MLARRHLFGAINDAALVQVVWSQLNDNAVTGQDADVVLTHLARDVCSNDMTIVQLYAEGRVWKGVNNLAFHFNVVFFCHISCETI